MSVERLKFNCTVGMAEVDPNGQFVDWLEYRRLERKSEELARMVDTDFARRLEGENARLRAVLEELVRVQDETACVWRTSPIMDRIRAVLANKTDHQ